MIELEDHLRNALARQAAPPDLTQKVLLRAARIERQRVRWWQPWAAGCLAASLLIGSLAIANVEQRREIEHARYARAKVMQALAITSGKLHHIEKQLEGFTQ